MLIISTKCTTIYEGMTSYIFHNRADLEAFAYLHDCKVYSHHTGNDYIEAFSRYGMTFSACVQPEDNERINPDTGNSFSFDCAAK